MNLNFIHREGSTRILICQIMFMSMLREHGFNTEWEHKLEDSNEAPGRVYQADYEADTLIWTMSCQLGGVPILTSDTDFHIYACTVPHPPIVFPFHRYTFRPGPNSKPAMYVNYHNFPQHCIDSRVIRRDSISRLTLVPVILGNDVLPSRIFNGMTQCPYSKKVGKNCL